MTDHQHTADVLNRAADLIEERGWVQCDGWPMISQPDDSPLCLEGGIMAALGWRFGEGPLTITDAPFRSCSAYQAVKEYFERVQTPLYDWNDAEGRTAAEVIEVLRAAAVIEQARADEHAATDTGYDTAAEMLLLGAAGAAIAGGRA